MLIGELLQDARSKLADDPPPYNCVRKVMIREFTESVEDGFETAPLEIEVVASMKDLEAGESAVPCSTSSGSGRARR